MCKLVLSVQVGANEEVKLAEKNNDLIECAADSIYIYNFPLIMAQGVPGQSAEVGYIQSIQLTWFRLGMKELMLGGLDVNAAKTALRAEVRGRATDKINKLLGGTNQDTFNKAFLEKVLPIQEKCTAEYLSEK